MPTRSPTVPRSLKLAGFSELPTIFVAPGAAATKRFLEFFTVNIRNRNTRAAARFLDWCEQRGRTLETITPMTVAAYVETLSGEMAIGSVKQQLAAIRMLFDWLTTHHVLESNPARSARSAGPAACFGDR